MRNRVQRQLAIKQEISGGDISSQEELLVKLRKNGYNLTQATLSRDLKALQVAKVPDPRLGYKYRIPDHQTADNHFPKNSVNYISDGFLDLLISGNLAVIKTLPGYASSIAIVIDRANRKEILGTIAGDDTILVILREGVTGSELKKAFITIMPKLAEKFI